MKVLLFAAFVFAVITLTIGASGRESNEKHSVKQHASRRIGNRLQNPGPDNIRPDVDSDERVLESDLEEYEDDEWPYSQLDIVESEELELDEVNRSQFKKARRAAKKAVKKAAKKARRTPKKARKTLKKAKKATKKAAAVRKRLLRERRRRRRRHPRRYPPRTVAPRRTRTPKRYKPTPPPSKGPKYCRCRMVAKPAKECYSYTNAEKGYCRLRNCDAKWECLSSGRSKHVCMQKFAMQKIIPVRNYGKYTKCRTVRHRKKPFYVFYRTTKSYPRPRPTKPSRYTRGRPRYPSKPYPKKYPRRE